MTRSTHPSRMAGIPNQSTRGLKNDHVAPCHLLLLGQNICCWTVCSHHVLLLAGEVEKIWIATRSLKVVLIQFSLPVHLVKVAHHHLMPRFFQGRYCLIL